MAGLNRDTDGFIQTDWKKVFLLSHISLDVSHPSWLLLPCCRGQKREKLNQRETRSTRAGRWEYAEGDGEDETRQGGTLSQQGARRGVERTMLSGGPSLPISSHYYFIPPSVCTSHPHFPFSFFSFFAVPLFVTSAQGQVKREQRHKRN